MLKSLFVLTLLIPLVTSPVLAYHIYENESVYIEANWIREPVVVTELNGIEIFIKNPNDDAPISALEDKIIAELQFKEKTITLSLDEDHENPGRYVGWVMPMLEGNYNLHLSGEINGQLVENQFKLIPVQDVSYEKFPFPPTPGPSQEMIETTEFDVESLVSEVDDLREQAEGFMPVVITAIGLAALAVGLSIVGIIKKAQKL